MVEVELTIDKFVWKDKYQNYSTEETILFKGGRFELKSNDESVELTDEYIKAQGPNRRKVLKAAMELCKYNV